MWDKEARVFFSLSSLLQVASLSITIASPYFQLPPESCPSVVLAPVAQPLSRAGFHDEALTFMFN